MSTYAQTQLADSEIGQRPLDVPALEGGVLTFWLPLVLSAAMMIVAQHRFMYATPEFHWGEILKIDLVSELGGSNTLRQLSFLTLGVLGMVLLSRRAANSVRISGPLLFLTLTVGGWVVLSAIWADDFGLSLKRVCVLLLMLVAALGMGKHWQPRQLCLFAALISALFVIVGVAAEFAHGTLLRGSGYRFSGTMHPNEQGVNCALLCLASLSLFCGAPADSENRARRLWLIPAVGGAVLLVLTGSRTATCALLAGLLFFWWLSTSGLGRIMSVFGWVTVFLGGSALLLVADLEKDSVLLDVVRMGREQQVEDVLSLSGRIPIWTAVLEDVSQRPMLGYGYGAFWTSDRVLQYSDIHNWEFAHAHSSYFETLLNVGAIGLGLGLLTLFVAGRTAARAFDATRDSGFRFMAALLAMALVHGFVDANFVSAGQASLFAMLCITVVLFQAKGALEQ